LPSVNLALPSDGVLGDQKTMANPQPGVWGIDIGQCALKAIRLEVVEGQVTATAFDYVEHSKILSQPDADPDQLTREALEKFLSRNAIKGDEVAISVPGQSGLARFVKLPPVEEKKIPDIVRFEAKQQIPFPLDEVVWDFQKIGAGAVSDGFAMETEIGLFALKRDMVNRYLQHFKDVSVEIHVVQMAPLALCNFVSFDLLGKDAVPAAGSEGAEGEEEEARAAPKKGSRSCVVALDIGTDNSNLVVTDGERVIWQRPIPFGGNHFTRVLTKDLKLTFAKAEHLKRNATKSPDLKKILASLKPVLNDFVGEVQRSLGYFTNTHRDASIEYMAGLGNAFRLPGMQKFLSEKLQLDVRRLPKFDRLSGESVTGAPSFTQNVMSFATAYGLALQGLKLTRLQTNLLPPEIQFDRMVRAKKPWAVTAAASLLVGVLATTIHYALQYRAVAAESVQTAMKDGDVIAKKAADEKASYDRTQGEVTAKENALRDIFYGADERLNWLMLVKYINESLPQPGAVVEGKFKDMQGTRFVVTDRDGKDHTFPADDVQVLENEQPVKRLANLKKDAYVRVIYNDTVLSDEGKKYWTQAAQDAFRKHWQRQASGKGADVHADDEGAEDLMQINVEGVTPLYSNDLKGYLDHLKDNPRNGGDVLQTGILETEAKSPPDGKGWVVEVRGYTFHKDRSQFLINTLVANLAARAQKQEASASGAKTAAAEPPPKQPEKAQAKADTAKANASKKAEPAPAPSKKIDAAELEEAWTKVIPGKVSHVALYDFNPNMDGTTTYALGSVVSKIVSSSGGGGQPGAPAGPRGGAGLGGLSVVAASATNSADRVGNWTPLGPLESQGGGVRNVSVAIKRESGSRGAPAASRRGRVPGVDSEAASGSPASTKDQKAKPKIARTDFIVLFIWKEPTPSDERRGK
jgi:type IV pilus assembly protein PilM